MSDWTSLNAIMQDLSVAQGRDVPASLKIFGNGAPSIASYEEETEEEYYKSCGDVDYSQPPDFRLIKEMLDMVKRETEESVNVDNDDILYESNLNPLSLEFQPGKRHRTQIEMKKKRERNVAIESILQSLEMNTAERHCEISKSPMSMFKSKRKVENRCGIVSPPTPRPDSIVNQVENKVYIPTKLADIYYNKYKENAKLKEDIRDDIWTRVEQQMKKNEDRKFWRLKESPCRSAQSSSSEVSETNGIYKVTLEQYRHLLLDYNQDCIVCDVAAKHGYHFEDEEC